MKRILTLALLCLVALSSFAQVSEEKNVLKVNTLSLLLGAGSIFYEREFTDNLSGQMGVAYLNYKINDAKFKGLILTPEIRLYVKKNAIDGFYIAPYVRYQNYSLEGNGGKGTYSNIGGGICFGRQWITNSGFTMDLFFGGHYGSGKVKVEEQGTEDFETAKFDGFKTRIGFALGFAF